jgi:hypothetical protein
LSFGNFDNNSLLPLREAGFRVFDIPSVAGKAIGFAPEQPLHVVALACSASGMLKQLEYTESSFAPEQLDQQEK